MIARGTPGEFAMHLDRVVALAGVILFLLTKGAAIAAAPTPDSDQPSTDPSPAAVATPATRPDPEILTAAPEVPAAATIDSPIVEQLHNLASGKFDRIIGSTKERASIDAFYAGRDYTPLWLTDGKVNVRAAAAIAYLGRVSADGLEPADYPVPDFASLTDPVALANAEITLTNSVITYARHAQIGRVH